METDGNTQSVIGRKRNWRRANKEKSLQRAREWKHRNPDKIREYKKRDYIKNIDRYKEYYKNRYLKESAKRSEAAKRWRAENPEAYRAKKEKESARRRADPITARRLRKEYADRKWVEQKMYSLRSSAKAQGVDFDLDIDWLKEKISAGMCELSGLPFEGRGKRPNAPSVDRKVAGGPYTKANCRMILWSLNRALGNLGEDYFIGIFRAIAERRGETIG